VSVAETIGIDLGGTKMAVGVVDSHPEVLYRATERSLGLTAKEILAELEEEAQAAREARPGVEAVGLGIPCTIDQERGLAIAAVNLPIANVPIRDLMRDRLGLPVFIDNDANVAVLAEHLFGAARDAPNVVLLTLGTGIGGGVLIDGRVFRGSTGAGAELGHVVVDENGPPCQGNCPNHGCVETLASGTAIARDGRAAAADAPDSPLGRAVAAGEPIEGRTVIDAAVGGDEIAREVVETAGRHLGVALSTLANIFEPNLFVVGGGVMASAGEMILVPAREELRSRALPPQNETAVVEAELGPDAGMIGAAAMARLALDGK
jgi:glucokinase